MSGHSPTRRRFTEAALQAAQAARTAMCAEPARFGLPELFVTRTVEGGFTWELRRFGGIVLQRGDESFDNMVLARVAGNRALTILCAAPDMPALKRDREQRMSKGVISLRG